MHRIHQYNERDIEYFSFTSSTDLSKLEFLSSKQFETATSSIRESVTATWEGFITCELLLSSTTSSGWTTASKPGDDNVASFSFITSEISEGIEPEVSPLALRLALGRNFARATKIFKI